MCRLRRVSQEHAAAASARSALASRRLKSWWRPGQAWEDGAPVLGPQPRPSPWHPVAEAGGHAGGGGHRAPIAQATSSLRLALPAPPRSPASASSSDEATSPPTTWRDARRRLEAAEEAAEAARAAGDVERTRAAALQARLDQGRRELVAAQEKVEAKLSENRRREEADLDESRREVVRLREELAATRLRQGNAAADPSQCGGRWQEEEDKEEHEGPEVPRRPPSPPQSRQGPRRATATEDSGSLEEMLRQKHLEVEAAKAQLRAAEERQRSRGGAASAT